MEHQCFIIEHTYWRTTLIITRLLRQLTAKPQAAAAYF